MPYIQFNGQQFPLGAADVTVGAFDGAAVRLPGTDRTAHAVLKLGPDGTGIIRRGASDAVVVVNGVQLGAEPSPLLHGDRIEIGGAELRYGEDKKGGSTQFLSSVNLPDAVKARAGVPRKPTTATGGRLVSLVDGREYTVPDTGVGFGREIGNDIVIASSEVSRRHAQIVPSEDGYALSDLSTNGVFVNGVRVEKTQLLGRGDVIKIGPEEFRFYADVARPAPAVPASVPAAGAPPSAPPAPAPAAATPPSPPELLPAIELEDAFTASSAAPAVAKAAAPQVATAPTAPPAASAPPPAPPAPAAPAPPKPAAAAPAVATAATAAHKPLATLEVINEGPMKGTRFDIHGPLTNIGRGAHNDVVLTDESVSDSHAKIIKRDGAWWVVDQGSTNGTYVGGRRVHGEQQLTGAPDVRFGSMKMIFRPTVVTGADEGTGTRAFAAFNVDAARKAGAKGHATAAPPKPEEPAEPVEKKKGCAAMIAFLVAAAAIGATTLAYLTSARG